MKTSKKFISVILAAVIAFSCFALCAFAADTHEHSYTATVVPPTCADQGYTVYVCATCGDSYKDSYTSALGHIYGEWKTTADPSCTEEGMRERTCIRCKAVQTNTVSVIDHVDANSDGKCDFCGADMSVDDDEYIFNPFDWLVQFFKFLKEWFAGIFG